MKETLCDNCGQYKMRSNRSRWLQLALISFIVSGAATVFIITIPLLVFTLPILVFALTAAIFSKGWRCANCGCTLHLNLGKNV